MDEKEFERYVQQTRLSRDSREAARLVFVAGKSQVEAADIMEMSKQRVNQIVKTVERVQEQEKHAAQHALEVVNASYAVAVKNALEMYGDGIRMQAPDEGKNFVGPVTIRTDFHLVQSLGKDTIVVHDIAKLDRVPPTEKTVSISYRDGRGAVEDRSQLKERGGISR